MRILFIAPDSVGINWPQEIEIISRWHQVTPLLGNVTQERLTAATTGARYDIVHFAAHGTANGIRISDGLLTREQIGQIARQVRADLVFFNACDSARLGQFLVDTGTPSTLAYTVEALDTDAVRIAAYFYEELADHNGDYRIAYARATPHDGSLAWFSDGSFVDRLIAPLIAQLQALAQQFNDFRKQVGGDQKSIIKVVAAALAGILIINGVALWAIALAATAQAAELPQPQAQQVAPPGALSLTETGEPATPGGTLSAATATPDPGCNESNGQPKKCTPEPASTATVSDQGGTIPQTATTVAPTSLPTSIPTAVQTEAPTATPAEATPSPTRTRRSPTSIPTLPPPATATDVPATATSSATATDVPATATSSATATDVLATATSSPTPTRVLMPTLTLTPSRTPLPPAIQDMVDRAVQATIAAMLPHMCKEVCQP